MDTQKLLVGDDVHHKTSIQNRKKVMKIAELKNHQALCIYLAASGDDETIIKESWFPVEELEKVIYGRTP